MCAEPTNVVLTNSEEWTQKHRHMACRDGCQQCVKKKTRITRCMTVHRTREGETGITEIHKQQATAGSKEQRANGMGKRARSKTQKRAMVL